MKVVDTKEFDKLANQYEREYKRGYKEVREELYEKIKNIARKYIPKICRAARDEYMEPEWTDVEVSEVDIPFRNRSVKMQVLYRMQGVLYTDKLYSLSGQRLLPRIGGKRLHSRFVYDKDGLPSKSIDVYSRPKDQSEISKFVEQLVDKEINSWDK